MRTTSGISVRATNNRVPVYGHYADNLREEKEKNMKKVFFAVFVGFLAVMFSGCYWNVEKIKSKAADRFTEAGFEIVVNRGTQMSITGGTVWYMLKKTKSPEKGLYSAALSYMLSGDLGLYYIKSIDAVEIK